ncbi:MAG: acyl-ACP--UDP-N-acetylglucosamine O-acyltransferase [Magnetococcales bacterium]|nr:acyl-ACP--UDP-N-acetylglucosamine O-acyltransferase [Magnetococcales bacterium]
MIHPSAVIDPKARVGKDVQIGPFCVVGPDVVLDDRVQLGSHVVIEGHTEIGSETKVSSFVAIGQPPQDVNYAGQPTRVVLGKHNDIREFVTIHRGTEKGGGLTQMGDGCMLMAYCHIAHDCRIGDHVVMANAATLAGHVEIQDHAVIGGLTAIHQFARVGRNSFIGGASAVSMDVVPFASAAGNRSRVTGVNVVGMRRSGYSEDDVRLIRAAHRVIFRSNLRLEEAISQLERDHPVNPNVQCIVEFLQNSQRGICR